MMANNSKSQSAEGEFPTLWLPNPAPALGHLLPAAATHKVAWTPSPPGATK